MDSSDFKKEAVDLEKAFFAKENARLLKELRAKREHEERRELLRKVVSIQDNAFLDRLIALGIGPETAMALRLIPLVFVAWADGSVDEREREAILKAATKQGLASEEMAHRALKDWLKQQPDPKLLLLWKDYVRHIWSSFTEDEQLQMRENLLNAAREVANAAGGFLGMAKTSATERQVLEDLETFVD